MGQRKNLILLLQTVTVFIITFGAQSFLQVYYSFLLQEKSQNSGGEFTLDIYVKQKDDNPCRPKVISLHIVCTFKKMLAGEKNKGKKSTEEHCLDETPNSPNYHRQLLLGTEM